MSIRLVRLSPQQDVAVRDNARLVVHLARGRAGRQSIVGALLLALSPSCGASPAGPPASPQSSPASMPTLAADAPLPRPAPTSQHRSKTCVTNSSELCLNGIDDNCNGLTDEGCGQSTSSLQFLVVWRDPAVDIDLEVTGPSGELASSSKPNSDGLVRGPDCPAATELCQPRNHERVTRASDRMAPSGRYGVTVRLRELHGAESPVQANLSARVGLALEEHTLRFHAENQILSYTFELPAPANETNRGPKPSATKSPKTPEQ